MINNIYVITIFVPICFLLKLILICFFASLMFLIFSIVGATCLLCHVASLLASCCCCYYV